MHTYANPGASSRIDRRPTSRGNRLPFDSIKSKKDGLITKPIVLGREFESKSSRTIYRIIVFILSIKNSSRRKDLGNVMSLMFEIAE